MTYSTTKIETSDLNEAELDTVVGGCAQVLYEVPCPIGHLTIVWPVAGEKDCPTGAVQYHPR
jgi:hypothetical protein